MYEIYTYIYIYDNAKNILCIYFMYKIKTVIPFLGHVGTTLVMAVGRNY